MNSATSTSPARTWEGSFISGPAASQIGDPAVYFRREFDVRSAPLKATLTVTALGVVTPYVNGSRVGDEVLAPGWTSYRHHLVVSTHDVTSRITAGPNVIGAVVGEGWAVGPLTWENVRHNYTDRPALFAQLELEYDDHTEIIATDPRFSISTGAVRANGIYDGETYDARLEPNGWNEVGFDDRQWSAAVTFPWSLDTLVDPIAPPIRRIEELEPLDLRSTDRGTTVIDFGQVISGWVRLRVTGNAGTEITLRHAESLTPSGDLERETNRTAEATDRYILSGDPNGESWEPQFTFHGFRYVEVEGWPGALTPESLRAVVIHSDMKRTGWFTSSNDLVNKLHANTVWSMRGNFVGIPTDCPQRDERLGWTGDLNAFAPTATFLYDVNDMLRSWLRDLAAEQHDAGTVPWVVPDVLTTPSSATALWSDVAVSLPWQLYQEYADLSILRDSYPSMTAFVREVEALLDEHGLWSSGFQFGDWLDPDAPAGNPAGGKTDRYLVASAYLVKTTGEMAQTAALLGEDEDSAHFSALNVRVRNAFRREFVTDSGRIVEETATAYALAIMFGILDDDQRQKAGDRLAEVVARSEFRIATGFAGTPLVTHALSSTGHVDAAYRLLLETGCPSFLYPVTMGATTIWERWDAVLPDGSLNSTGMTSLNHYALGAVADWLHRVVGGLERGGPGWTHALIAPKPGGGLTSARIAHDTVHGRVEVSWRIGETEMFLEASVPAGMTASVTLPLLEGATEEVGAGEHAWRYPLPGSYGQTRLLTMDSTMADLAENPQVWDAVRAVTATHFPDMPMDAGIPGMAGLSLTAILDQIPAEFPGFRADLQAALATSQSPREPQHSTHP